MQSNLDDVNELVALVHANYLLLPVDLANAAENINNHIYSIIGYVRLHLSYGMIEII